MIEPCISDRVIIQPCIAHIALAHDGMFAGALILAVQSRRDDGVLLVGGLAFSVITHKVVSRKVWSDGNVVPGHDPKAGNMDRHRVRLPYPAFTPCWIIRRALNHRAAGGVRHYIAVDALGTIHS